ncbi:MAG: hypothetical protein JXA37_07560 [Chloroflexia bacterium]|nr:hypothetical protein [Chloroflexia bacterium]
METEPHLLLQIYNQHTDACGVPAAQANTDGRYYGYYANEYGEQFVFVYDLEAEAGALFGGDLHWDNPVAVVEGRAEGILLGEGELQWLAACWRAVMVCRRLREERRRERGG